MSTAKSFEQQVADHKKVGEQLKVEMFKLINSDMRRAIQNEFKLDVLDKYDEGDTVMEGIDFRSIKGEDKSFFINGDDTKDAIVGVTWDEDAGIALLVRERDDELYSDVHPTDDQLNPSDVLEVVGLMEVWMVQGL